MSVRLPVRDFESFARDVSASKSRACSFCERSFPEETLYGCVTAGVPEIAS